MEETRPAGPAGNGAGAPSPASGTSLAAGDALVGTLTMKSGGQLLGSFSGRVECEGELLVGREAEVAADVSTRNITIAGTVRGNVVASGRLKITSTGRLEGDARVGSLVVQEGGVHHGAIRVHPEGLPAEPEPETPAPATPARLTASVESVRRLLGELF